MEFCMTWSWKVPTLRTLWKYICRDTTPRLLPNRGISDTLTCVQASSLFRAVKKRTPDRRLAIPRRYIYRPKVPTKNIMFFLWGFTDKYNIFCTKITRCERIRRVQNAFSNSLIIHQVKTKKITTVTEVWIISLDFDDFISHFTP